MAIDASIALRQPQNQLNPMQSMGQAVQLGTNMLQARILGQEMAANQSISRAYQQATNPQTGQVDTNKLSALISQDPRAAWKLPQVQGQIADQRNKQVQYDKSQIELMMKKQNATGNFMAPIVADPGLGRMDMSQRIYSTIGDLVNNGLLDPQQAQQVAGQVPRDPMGQAQFVKSLWMRNLQGAEQLKAMMPQVQSMDLGGSTVTVGYDPMTGKPIQGTAMTFNKSMAPGEAATPVQVTNPDGSVTTTTKGNFAQGMGGSGQGGLGGITGPKAGYTEGQAVQAQNAAKEANDLSTAAADAPVRIQQLMIARDALQGIDTGPGQETFNHFKTALNNTPIMGNIARGLGMDPNNIKDFDEFKKVMTQYAMRQSSQNGGTDAKMAAAIAGNPNTGISKLANQEILKVVIGQEYYTSAKNAMWQDSGMPAQDYQKWSSAFNKQVDPRVFVYGQMDEKAQKAMYDRMSEKERESFTKSYRAMSARGLLGN